MSTVGNFIAKCLNHDYVFYSAIGWTGEVGYLPLLIPGMFGSIGTMFFLRLFFDGIPTSLIEAAMLDGAGFS